MTSNPKQDRILLESEAILEAPLLNNPEALSEGHYLWFNDRQFPGCDAFYRDRARLFHIDSVKNKLGIEARHEFFLAAEKLFELGLR